MDFREMPDEKLVTYQVKRDGQNRPENHGLVEMLRRLKSEIANFNEQSGKQAETMI